MIQGNQDSLATVTLAPRRRNHAVNLEPEASLDGRNRQLLKQFVSRHKYTLHFSCLHIIRENDTFPAKFVVYNWFRLHFLISSIISDLLCFLFQLIELRIDVTDKKFIAARERGIPASFGLASFFTTVSALLCQPGAISTILTFRTLI